MKKLFILALTIACSVEARGEAVKSVRLILPPHPDAVVANIGRVFARQIESRCDAKVALEGDAPLTVELAVEPGIGEEGFKIADGAAGTVRICGNDARGLLYGAGKFLHNSAYGSGGFTPGAWRGISVPKMPVRGIYLATHFQNYYQVAPIEEVGRYMEDLSLWGTNSFLLWFGMEEFNGIDDPKAQAMLERLRACLRSPRAWGSTPPWVASAMTVTPTAPRSFAPTPARWGTRGIKRKWAPAFTIWATSYVPASRGFRKWNWAFAGRSSTLSKTSVWTTGSSGRTTTADARARNARLGANGFPRMAEPLARAYRREFPQGKVILGTWYFDRWGIGEWDGITAKFAAKKPDWVDYIMADNFEDYPRYPLDKGVPGGLPLLNFPDISMYGQDPWGGYGVNPHPARLQQRWDETRQKLSGGFPYSEGIYEDLNKVICAQLYWGPDRPAIETVKDYAAFEFSPEVADDIVSVVKIFEKNHLRNQIGGTAIAAFQTIEQADAKLTRQARESWRWRLFASGRRSTRRCTGTLKAGAERMFFNGRARN